MVELILGDRLPYQPNYIIQGEAFLYIKQNFYNEFYTARHFARIRNGIKPLRIYKEEIINFFADHNATYKSLTSSQKNAIITAITSPMCVITGGPGTGKTFVTNAIIHTIKTIRPNAKVDLAAPTGKAANRMASVTSCMARTIHTYLHFAFGVSDLEEESLCPEFLIVDEYSMADAELTAKLLATMSSETRIIFVGDYNQLPSVGPGLILREFIHSEKIPVVELEAVFRQTGSSSIVVNANSIINYSAYQPFSLKTCHQHTAEQDFFFIENDDPLTIQDLTIRTIQSHMKNYGYRMGDIQVLSPVKMNELGTKSLNTLIQEEFNKTKQYYEVEEVEFRVGDKVIHTKNNYDLGVFNGDTGIVKAVGATEDQVLLIAYNGRDVWYDTESSKQLDLAYAITVHKSQGSEFKVVIIPIHEQLSFNLNRNLIYTAITRAKERVIIIGDYNTLLQGVQKEMPQRNSNLIQRLDILLP